MRFNVHNLYFLQVQQMHTLERNGLHHQCMEWTMFLSSSDYEFDEYCQNHIIPKSFERQRNVKELSNHINISQKEHVTIQHAWFGAMMGGKYSKRTLFRKM